MNTVKDGKRRVLRIDFDGVDDLMQTANRFKDPKNGTVRRNVNEFRHCFCEADGWNGKHTLEMVGRELLAPTPKMAGVIDSGESLFSSEEWATEKPRRKVLRRLEDGDEIDIDRWREREPDMWEESRKQDGPRFGVRIGVNIATSAHVDAEGFKWRTSAVVAILSICEELQIPCEVMCYEKSRKFTEDGYGCCVQFPVKRPESLLDIDLLAYVLGSQSFYRTAVLGGMIIATGETHPEMSIGSGLGYPDAYVSDDAGEFVLDRGCLNEQNARREVKRFKDWLVEIRRKAGINFDGLDSVEA